MNDVIGSARRAAKTMWKRDPLLAAARLALILAMGFSAFMAAAFVIATPAVLIMNERIMDTLARNGGPPESIWAVISVVALARGSSPALGFFFFRDLYRIVASVEGGDPFVPINARRLQAMGWISVAVHVLGIPLAMTSRWLDQIFHRPHGALRILLLRAVAGARAVRPRPGVPRRRAAARGTGRDRLMAITGQARRPAPRAAA